MVMPDRTFSAGAYKYSINGQEKDDDISGEGNHTTAEFWEYDSRLGRRWNVDPVTFSWQSPYATFNNNPFVFTDINGKEGKPVKSDPNSLPVYDDGCITSNSSDLMVLNSLEEAIRDATKGKYGMDDLTSNTKPNLDKTEISVSGEILKLYQTAKKETGGGFSTATSFKMTIKDGSGTRDDIEITFSTHLEKPKKAGVVTVSDKKSKAEQTYSAVKSETKGAVDVKFKTDVPMKSIPLNVELGADGSYSTSSEGQSGVQTTFYRDETGTILNVTNANFTTYISVKIVARGLYDESGSGTPNQYGNSSFTARGSVRSKNAYPDEKK
jgi:hypothetical protein